MGRPAKENKDKKVKITVNIEKCNIEDFEEFEVKNKSQLINWLLRQHFEGLDVK